MSLTNEADLDERDAVEAQAKPGIYPDISAAVYHRMDAVASHVLQGFYRSPAHARELLLHPFESSDVQRFGQAFHSRVLEPALFPLLYVVPPKIDRRTKVGKEQWTGFEEASRGKTLLDFDSNGKIDDMARSLERHPTAVELLAAPGMNEVTVLWHETLEVSGHEVAPLCKARLDRLCTLAGDTWIVDLKTARDASERGFERAIGTYRYHMQMGWYARGLNAHHAAPRRVAFIAIETDRPYVVNVLELDQLDLEQGEREALRHLRTLVECRLSGIYPGYGDGMGYVGLPQWAKEA